MGIIAYGCYKQAQFLYQQFCNFIIRNQNKLTQISKLTNDKYLQILSPPLYPPGSEPGLFSMWSANGNANRLDNPYASLKNNKSNV